MPRRKQTKPSHVPSDDEGEPETGTRSKRRSSSSPSKGKGGGGGGGGDGQKEEQVVVESRGRKGRTRQSAIAEEKRKEEEEKAAVAAAAVVKVEEEEEEVDVEVEEPEPEEEEEEEDEDDGDKELLIAEDEIDKDSDDCDSDLSEDLEPPAYNGTMTRRQASQLKEGGGAGGVAASGDLTGAKKKNRTCDYCGVVKATPAALVRHLRKHTGERPFVCTLCGKAYKAKRSLNLHENTVHKGLSKNPLPTQVPLDASVGTSSFVGLGDSLKQVGGVPPPISEATKSLLRVTLESSRKAKDATTANVSSIGENGATTATTTTAATTTYNSDGNGSTSETDLASVPASERLSAPNLVNLLTSDISKKTEQALPAATSITTTTAAAAAVVPETSSSSLLSSSSTTPPAMTSPPSSSTQLPVTVSCPLLSIPKIKTDTAHHIEQPKMVKEEMDEEEAMEEEEDYDGDDEDRIIVDEEKGEEEEEEEQEEEEQAQDLSIHTKREKDTKPSVEVTDKPHEDAAGDGGIICEFCPKIFQDQLQKVNHIRQAHGIILNLSHDSNNKNNKIPSTVIAPQSTTTAKLNHAVISTMSSSLSSPSSSSSSVASMATSKKSTIHYHNNSVHSHPHQQQHSHSHHKQKHHHHHQPLNHSPQISHGRKTTTATTTTTNHNHNHNHPTTTMATTSTTASSYSKQQPPPPSSSASYMKTESKKTPGGTSTTNSPSSMSSTIGAFMDPKTWAAMVAAASNASHPHFDSAINNYTANPANAFSALFAMQLRDQQLMHASSSLTSSALKPPPPSSSSVPSSLPSSSSSIMHQVGVGDGGVVKIENGPAVPIPSLSSSSGLTDGSTLSPPMEESNALPYYVTSRILHDPDDVTLPEPAKWVTAEDGGHRQCRTTVMKETVLATRLDGINNITGRLATVYKCHLCKRVFSSLIRYNHHMPAHAEGEITTYDCRYCEASFRSHIQIIKHLQCHREKFAGIQPLSVDDSSPLVGTSTASTTTATTASGGGHKKKGDHPHHHNNQGADSSSPGLSLSSNNGNGGPLNLMRSLSYNAKENGGETPIATSLVTDRHHEPGERKNGGYSCPKCCKNFTREYLLQRHMRIHRNQNSFYCPDSESGFSGELDLMEHRKNHHGLNSSEEVQKYKSLLTQQHRVQQASRQGAVNQQMNKAISADGKSNVIHKSGGGIVADLSTPPSSSSSNCAPGDKSLSNKAGDNGVVSSNGIFPMDLKGIDLQRGEEVQVRMMGGLSEDKQKEEWLKQVWNESYKQAYLSKVLEMQQAILSAGNGGLQDGGAVMEQVKQNVMRSAQERMKRLIMEGEIKAASSNSNNNSGRMNGGEEAGKSRVDDEERAKQKMANRVLRQQQLSALAQKKKDEEERRKMEEEEQAQLKAKLAQQGMGDVIVVLPDAPSPEQTNGNGLSSTSSKLEERANEQPETGASCTGKFKGDGYTSRFNDKDKTALSKHEGDCIMKGENMEVNHDKMMESGEKKLSEGSRELEDSVVTVGSKRPSSSETGSGGGVPPAKSRRKALKPQKINHFEEEVDVSTNKDTAPTAAPGDDVHRNTGSKPVGSSTKTGTVAGHHAAGDNNTLLLSKWKQLVALGGAQVFSAAAQPTQPSTGLTLTDTSALSITPQQQQQLLATGTPLNVLTARSMMNQGYPHKLLPGFDPTSGAPVLFNSDNDNAVNDTIDEDSCDGMAIDLSTSSSSSDKDKSLTKSKLTKTTGSTQAAGPQFSSTPKSSISKMSGLSALSAAAAAISGSVSSAFSSSTSPVKLSESDVKSCSESQKKSSHQVQKSSGLLSRSSSMDQELEGQGKNSPDKHHSRKDAASTPTPSSKHNLQQLHFTNALLSGATGMTPETAALVALPQALWSAAAVNHQHNLTAAAIAAAANKSSLSPSSSSSPPSTSKSITNSSAAIQTPGKSKNSTTTSGGGGGVPDSGLPVGLNFHSSNSNSSSKSRTSSPSSISSPVGAGETASNDGRKVTSLSRTHSRLSVVNEPLDRNALCKPKVMEDGRSVYSCAICNKNFLSLSDINRHMDFHQDIRPYKCKYCDYYARTNSQLKVHKLRHEGVREFCCRVCNYKGVTQSDLNRHTKSQVHLLRSNHVCPRCGEGFVTPKALRDHTATSCTGNRGEDDSSFDRSYDDEKAAMEAMEDEEEDDDDLGVGGEMRLESEDEEMVKMRRSYAAMGSGEEMEEAGMSSVVDMRMVV